MAKRITSLILCIFLLCAFSAGCRSSDKERDNEEASEKLVHRPDPVTLVCYYPSLDENKKAIQKVAGMIEDMTRDILNVKFDLRPINLPLEPEAMVREAKKFLESGTYFDLIILYGGPDWYKYVYYHKLGMYFLDITEYFPAYAPTYYSRFDEGDLAKISFNGRLYSIPSYSPYSKRLCAVVRKSLVEKYNLDPIRTLEDYEEFLRIVKEKEKDFIPTNLSPTMEIASLAYMYDYVICEGYMAYRWDDPEMKLVPWEQTDAFREMTSIFKDWYEKGYTRNYVRDENDDRGEASFLIMMEFSELHESWYRKLDSSDDAWVIYPLHEEKRAERDISGKQMYINKESKNVERIFKFLEWMQSSQENYDLLTYGIEGEDYRLVDGAIEKLKLADTLFPSRVSNIEYERNSAKALGKQVPLSKESYLERVFKNTEYPPHSGFVPSEKLIERIVKRDYDFMKENTQLIFGNFDIDSFIEAQIDSGVNEMRDEMQRELDQWRTADG